ncbi:MAG: SxtJ family membrane protein [Gammaproteobacteria bacterium]
MEATRIHTGKAELRNFGLVLGTLFAAFFGLLPLIRHHYALHIWPWCLAAVLWIVALLRPSMLSYLYVAWTRLGWALGWLNTRVILTAIYTLLIVPIGTVMRLCGRDRMGHRFDREAVSYRVASRKRPAQDLEHPF